MKKQLHLLALLIASSSTVMAAEHGHGAEFTDQRHVVEMPAEMKTMFLKNMRTHMESLDLVIASLANNNLAEAADIAESTMGVGHGKKRQCADKDHGKKHDDNKQQSEFKQSHNHDDTDHKEHKKHGKGFGKFMPVEMKMMGMNLHNAANNFAEVARQGDMGEAYKALRLISASCVACHQSFSVQ